MKRKTLRDYLLNGGVEGKIFVEKQSHVYKIIEIEKCFHPVKDKSPKTPSNYYVGIRGEYKEGGFLLDYLHSHLEDLEAVVETEKAVKP